MVLGAAFVLLGLIATPVVLLRDRSVVALALGSLSALFVAASVVAYTASRGYLLGGTTGGTPCIATNGPSGPACVPPSGPTYIADAQPDVSVMLLASIGAYALAHLAMRLRLASARRSSPRRDTGTHQPTHSTGFLAQPKGTGILRLDDPEDIPARVDDPGAAASASLDPRTGRPGGSPACGAQVRPADER